MKDIYEEQAIKKGIFTRYTDMENGELRYRLIGADNSSYIRTEAYKNCWENEHFHRYCKEMYIVQSGTIYLCELKENNFCIKKLQLGDYEIIEPMVIHNVYMCKAAIVHTVKFGHCEKDDWNASNELSYLKKLNSEDLDKIIIKNI